MGYLKHHTASYNLGERKLLSTERLVVSTRDGPQEPRRVAKHLGVSRNQPELLIKHKEWIDGEYLPSFQSKKCSTEQEFCNYLKNYGEPDNPTYGYGLKGRTVYIVHTRSNKLSVQDLIKRAELIAGTAKYHGAEAVVLLAYTLDYSAAERGVHNLDHPRMQTREAKERFDGQAPTIALQLKSYMNAGVDAIITPHAHCPGDLTAMCAEINDEYLPLHQQSQTINSNMRYKILVYDIDLAPMVGVFVSDFGNTHLDFDLSNNGENVLFLAPDNGATQFVSKVREHSGLTNSAMAFMEKKRSTDGRSIESLVLSGQVGLNTDRGISEMYVLLCDDKIRSGETIRRNTETLRGMQIEGLTRDSMIRGIPKRVAVYASETSLQGGAVGVLSSAAIDDLVFTNSDPRGFFNLGPLDCKSMMIWENFMIAEAAKAIERGIEPNEILTADYIRRNKLIRVEIPHGHTRLSGESIQSNGFAPL